MKNNYLAGKQAVVTGGASGIGAAIAHHFGLEGASITILDLQKDAIKNTVTSLNKEGIEAYGVTCDITDEKQCVSAIGTIIKERGGIDILVNNAGITQRSAFRETDISVYRKVMDVNFFGSVHCTKAALESIIKRKGAIIVTSSIAGLGPLLGRTGYCASKHALHGLFESLRTEVSHLGVHVLMLCPGFTRTNLQTRALDGNGSVTRHPQSTIGKVDSPDRVARLLFKALKKKKPILVTTASGKLGYLMTRFFPHLYERIITRKFRKELER